MIKFENYDIWGFEHALRGMRNPLESWERNDSGFAENCNIWEGDDVWYTSAFNYKIGPYDLALAQRLIQAGPEHRKFLRQIMVSVDITAPLYWWKEFDTYKVGTVANSCSTMHTIHTRPITLDDFSCEHLGLFVDAFNWDEQSIDILNDIISLLNKYRELFVKTKDRKYWWQIIQLLPSSYNQRRTVTLNYENLRSMYFQRRNHKLDEWRIGFCGWVEDLPYAEEFIMFDPKEDEDGAG
ncbi:MAG: hypothetical protein IKP88_21800 [Lachnospiraceae bacterium]|nr:hypothetical protein [Lachnospiraceae bacterium]